MGTQSLRRRIARARRKPSLSGSEPTYTDVLYGSPVGVRQNNCYGYAVGDYRTSGSHKLQPGDLSPGAKGDLDLRDCSDLRRRALRDGGYAVGADEPCKQGWAKVMAFVAPDRDFHWYKQHKDLLVRADETNTAESIARRVGVNASSVESPTDTISPGELVLVRNAGTWSHKRGFATGPLLEDACGKPIKDPRKACRNYDKLQYRMPCGAFCFKQRTSS